MKVGFLGLLAIVFTALKLAGSITWSWWWVLSPLWLPWAILAVIGMVSVCVAFVASR
jgi:hypothetical protein